MEALATVAENTPAYSAIVNLALDSVTKSGRVVGQERG